jgi:hypothetical protein
MNEIFFQRGRVGLVRASGLNQKHRDWVINLQKEILARVSNFAPNVSINETFVQGGTLPGM